MDFLQNGYVQLVIAYPFRSVGILRQLHYYYTHQHVFGQPTFATSDWRAYSQRKAFLAQQRVTAVSASIADDLIRLDSVNTSWHRCVNAERLIREIISMRWSGENIKLYATKTTLFVRDKTDDEKGKH